jgi:hypothetical protein
MSASGKKPLFMRRFILLLLYAIPFITTAQKNDSTGKMLQDRMACGVVSTGTASTTIRIRCGTITAVNKPMIIVDGTVITAGNLPAIDPNSIETITILKNDKAVSLFGSAALHGVIIISSKKGTIYIKEKETGQPVSSASVRIKLGDKFFAMVADSNGVVKLCKENFKAVEWIEVTSIGYEPVAWKPDSINSSTSLTIPLTKKHTKLDEVVVVACPAIYCSKTCCGRWVKCIKSYPNSKLSTQQFSSQLSIYPNPVSKGAQLTIIAKEGISGEYHIYSPAGALVQSGVIAATGDQPFSIATGSYPPGCYILSIINRTTGSLFTQKIIVQ